MRPFRAVIEIFPARVSARLKVDPCAVRSLFKSRVPVIIDFSPIRHFTTAFIAAFCAAGLTSRVMVSGVTISVPGVAIAHSFVSVAAIVIALSANMTFALKGSHVSAPLLRDWAETLILPRSGVSHSSSAPRQRHEQPLLSPRFQQYRDVCCLRQHPGQGHSPVS